jgi:hypothetical protein
MLDDSVLFALETEINRIYAEVETEMVSAIARELAKGSNASISPIAWRTEKLRQMGRLEGKLTDLLRRKSRQIQPELEDSIIRAMLGAGKEDDMVLAQIASVKAQIASGTFVEVSKSSVFEQLSKAAIANARTGLNLTNTQALQAASEIWTSAVNSAYVKTLTGSTSLDQAVKLSVREMGKQGAYVTYVSKAGRMTRTSLEVAVRRDVVTSVNQAAAEMTMGRCDEYECDLVEVSAHEGSRPEHAIWQGKVYSLHGKTPGYELFAVATGYGEPDGICGINCRHSFFPYFPGLSKQSQTIPGQRENEKTYKLTQQQRYLERNIRAAKREESVCAAGGDKAGAAQAHQRVRDYQEKMRGFIADTGFTRQYPREQIYT